MSLKVERLKGSKVKAALRRPPSTTLFDDACREYLAAQARAKHLWRTLYALARRGGVALKDAPKSRLLAGVEYEALASLATRTDVDQKKAAAAWRGNGPEACAFVATTVYQLVQAWERQILGCPAFSPGKRERIRARVLACLRTRPVKRLRVRKRRSVEMSKSRKVQTRRAA